MKMYLWDWLVCFEDFVRITLLAVLFLLPVNNCFLRVCFPTLLAAVLKIFLPITTSAFVVAENSNKSAPTRFAAGTIYLRKDGTAVLPITFASAPNTRSLCRPTTSPQWNLHSSWSNHLVTSFWWRIIVRRFSENQNKLSDNNRSKGPFFHCSFPSRQCGYYGKSFWAAVLTNISKGLIGHVVSSSHIVPVTMKWKKNNAAVRPSCCQRYCIQSSPSISWESVRGECRKPILACEVLFPQYYSKFIANITSETISWICTKKCKTRYFVCNVNLNCLTSSRHFNCDRVFGMIVSLLNESVRSFSNICNGRVKTKFLIVEFSWLWMFLVKKHEISLCNTLVRWWVG